MYKSMSIAATTILAVLAGCAGNGLAEPAKKDTQVQIGVVDRPDTTSKNAFYVSNREPLLASPFIKLPVGSIKPQGWVRRQLQLQADGWHGHLTEISDFLKKDDGAWLNPEGGGRRVWEEPPYWLKGFSNCAYILGDEKIIAEA